MALKRTATAQWQGTGAEGAGTVTAPGGVLTNTPYSFKTRFLDADGKAGTNPEELIAAAHAACFTMALSFTLGGQGFAPEQLETRAVVAMEKDTLGGFEIVGIELILTGSAVGASKEQFAAAAALAKANCPISKALAALPITLTIN